MADMIPPAGAAAFLADHDWDGAIVPLSGDASFRRYFRVASRGFGTSNTTPTTCKLPANRSDSDSNCRDESTADGK